jgi:hypothetical protein
MHMQQNTPHTAQHARRTIMERHARKLFSTTVITPRTKLSKNLTRSQTLNHST